MANRNVPNLSPVIRILSLLFMQSIGPACVKILYNYPKGGEYLKLHNRRDLLIPSLNHVDCIFGHYRFVYKSLLYHLAFCIEKKIDIIGILGYIIDIFLHWCFEDRPFSREVSKLLIEKIDFDNEIYSLHSTLYIIRSFIFNMDDAMNKNSSQKGKGFIHNVSDWKLFRFKLIFDCAYLNYKSAINIKNPNTEACAVLPGDIEIEQADFRVARRFAQYGQSLDVFSVFENLMNIDNIDFTGDDLAHIEQGLKFIVDCMKLDRDFAEFVIGLQYREQVPRLGYNFQQALMVLPDETFLTLLKKFGYDPLPK